MSKAKELQEKAEMFRAARRNCDRSHLAASTTTKMRALIGRSPSSIWTSSATNRRLSVFEAKRRPVRVEKNASKTKTGAEF